MSLRTILDANRWLEEQRSISTPTLQETMMSRVSLAIGVGASLTDIHDMLISAGMSEIDAYFTYIAGRILYNNRDTDISSERVSRRASMWWE